MARQRTYKLKRRAEKQAETRQRIVQAVVELHEEVGPAQTSISAIAERAGVQRLTVYRHFPDEAALFEACRDHWLASNPLPDPAPWFAISDPHERLRAALTSIYAFHERTRAMQANVERDTPSSPALAEVQEPVYAAFMDLHAALLDAWPLDDAHRPLAGAALAHAMAFSTWQSLTREIGLPISQAVDLMLALLTCVANHPFPTNR